MATSTAVPSYAAIVFTLRCSSRWISRQLTPWDHFMPFTATGARTRRHVDSTFFVLRTPWLRRHNPLAGMTYGSSFSLFPLTRPDHPLFRFVSGGLPCGLSVPDPALRGRSGTWIHRRHVALIGFASLSLQSS